jgi:antitoxin Xre/MbcA/ParS-like protein
VTGREEIISNLVRVLNPEGFARWLETPIPRLDGRTPLAALFEGDEDQVLDLTRSYLETSFT